MSEIDKEFEARSFPSLPTEALMISPEVISKLQDDIRHNQQLQKNIDTDDFGIRSWKEHWMRKSGKETKNSKALPIKEFLRINHLVEKNSRYELKKFHRKWVELVRWSNRQELKFLDFVSEIGMGKFIEVMQISLMSGGNIINKDVVVGAADHISGEKIDNILEKMRPKILKADTIYLVHNHWDEYEHLFVSEKENWDVNGLVRVGGLSKLDIDLADGIWEKETNKKAQVFMYAVNERGLTYFYQAGTSQSF
jgi:hypothetical protein